MKRSRSLLLFALVGASALVATGCPPQGGATNLPPTVVVNATPSSGTVPLSVAFSSVGTFDPEGTPITYQWDFGDGSPVDNNANPSHTYTAAGSYTAVLTAMDGTTLTATASTVITAGAPVNLPPTAVATAGTTVGRAPLTVAFTGDQSSDPENTTLSYDWNFGDNTPHSAVANPSHVYTAAGSYIATLTVTDGGGATNSANTAEITVNANQVPVAASSATPASGKEPLTVNFSSAGTADGDDATNTLSYSWNFGDGTALSTAANPTHVYANALGSPYTATLTVTDPLGASDTSQETVTVNANQAPVAVPNADVTAGQVPLIVNFFSTASFDDGTIVSRLWDFGGGITSNATNPQFTFGSVGLKTVSLTVTDDNGVSNTATIDIDVQPIPNVAPVAVGSAAPTSAKQGTTIQFTGDQSSDPDNTPGGLTYAWDFGDGGTSTIANPTHVFTTVGLHNVQLQVKDAALGANTVIVPVTTTADQQPTAVAGGTPLTGKAPLNVAFSSAGTNDADDATNTLTYAWTFSDGGSSNAANPGHTFTTAGAKTATLKVTDPFGKFDTTTVNITVTQNQAPTVVANGSPTAGPQTLTVNFSSAGTADVDDATNTLTYAWNFGDPASGSNTSTQANPTHAYATPGSYSASLTVSDPYGGSTTSAAIAVTVTVDADQDGVSPPTDCNDADNTTYPGAPDALDGSAKDSNCDGADGTVSDTVFVSTSGSDAAACTLAAPCQTIARGILAAGTSKHVIQVSNGAGFAGFTVSGTSGLTIRGGFATDFKSRTGTTTSTGGVTLGANTSLALQFLTIVGPGGINTTGITATGGSATLSNVTVNSGTAAGAGSSAYGIRALGGVALTINSSSITAQPGIAGTSGTTPSGALTAGTNGSSGGNGGNHAVPGGAGPGGGANSGGNGGNGDGSSGVGGANGGAGGGGGCNNCTSNSNYSGGGAAGGAAGPNGATGAMGAASQLAFGSSSPRPRPPTAAPPATAVAAVAAAAAMSYLRRHALRRSVDRWRRRRWWRRRWPGRRRHRRYGRRRLVRRVQPELHGHHRRQHDHHGRQRRRRWRRRHRPGRCQRWLGRFGRLRREGRLLHRHRRQRRQRRRSEHQRWRWRQRLRRHVLQRRLGRRWRRCRWRQRWPRRLGRRRRRWPQRRPHEGRHGRHHLRRQHGDADHHRERWCRWRLAQRRQRRCDGYDGQVRLGLIRTS
ncbi:MAG: PKD domain-containing protein [Acidimicrobiales bacterium]